MQVNPDSPRTQGLITFLSFIGLNVIYMVSCLPIVTIGAATSALYEVTYRYSDHESGALIRDYFIAFKENGVRATQVMAATLVPALLAVFASVFWLQYDTLLSGIAAVLAAVVAIYLALTFLIGMALVARFESPFSQTMRNALSLPGAEPARALGVLLIPATEIGLSSVFTPFLFIVVTIGFSLGAYGSAFLFRSMFGKHGGE